MDSGNGKMLFVFEPDFTQSGTYDVTFIASDGQLTDSQLVTITVTPYSVGELWPMAVGNYWVYETSKQYSPIDWTLDSICVKSSYQSDGVTHWLLSGGFFRYVGNDIAIRNDSMISYRHNVATPPVWPDRIDTVPAGIFKPTYEHWLWIGVGLPELESLVFAKSVGVIKYEWFNGSAHYPDGYEARLLRYRVQ